MPVPQTTLQALAGSSTSPLKAHGCVLQLCVVTSCVQSQLAPPLVGYTDIVWWASCVPLPLGWVQGFV